MHKIHNAIFDYMTKDLSPYVSHIKPQSSTSSREDILNVQDLTFLLNTSVYLIYKNNTNVYMLSSCTSLHDLGYKLILYLFSGTKQVLLWKQGSDHSIIQIRSSDQDSFQQDHPIIRLDSLIIRLYCPLIVIGPSNLARNCVTAI